MFSFLSRRFGSALCLSAALVGCSRYQADPIDTEQLRTTWATLDAQTVAAAVDAAFAPHTGLADFSLDDGIAEHEAERIALVLNPDLRITRLRAGVATAVRPHAGRWDDPTLDLDVERILADVDDPWVVGAGIGFTIPLSGRPGAQRRLASAECDAAEAAIFGAEWALTMQVRHAWRSLALARAQQTLITDSIADLERLRSGAEVLRQAGLASTLDFGDLELELLHLRDAHLRAVASEDVAYDDLLALLGLNHQQPWRFDTGLRSAPAAIVQNPSLDAHPMVRLAMAAHVIADHRLDLAIRGQYPDLHLGLGLGSEDGDPRVGFGLGLLPLPVWNLNREGIARSEAERVVARAEVEAAIITLEQERQRHARVLSHAERRLDFVRKELVVHADHQRQEAQRLAGLGHSDLFRLVDAVIAAHQARLLLLDAKAEAERAHLDVLASAGPLAQP